MHYAKCAGEARHDPVIPDGWESNNEMGRQFFTNSELSVEWELEFSSDGKARFKDVNSDNEQVFCSDLQSLRCQHIAFNSLLGFFALF